jgi:hypothetical protein
MYLKLYENFNNIIDELESIFIDSNDFRKMEFLTNETDDSYEVFISLKNELVDEFRTEYLLFTESDVDNINRTIKMIEEEYECIFYQAYVIFSYNVNGINYEKRGESAKSRMEYFKKQLLSIVENDILANFEDGHIVSIFKLAVDTIKLSFKKINNRIDILDYFKIEENILDNDIGDIFIDIPLDIKILTKDNYEDYTLTWLPKKETDIDIIIKLSYNNNNDKRLFKIDEELKNVLFRLNRLTTEYGYKKYYFVLTQEQDVVELLINEDDGVIKFSGYIQYMHIKYTPVKIVPFY